MKPLKVIISGGGTGGHIFPALAIANQLKKENNETEILFVGANGRMEMTKIPAAGYEIIGLDIAGLQRKFDLANFLLPIKLAKSFFKARQILKKFKPDIAIGVGGYASGPLLYIANLMGIPCLIQEQNSYAGITNKLLSKHAKKVCVAYEEMEKYFPQNKLVITGNPIRENIENNYATKEEAENYFGLNSSQKTVLIIGGSLGARTINLALNNSIKKLVDNNIQVIWQTGKFYYETAKNHEDENVKVYEFLERMDFAYAVADIVVSRAGALSISELCATSKPMILVPSPNVAEDHQTKNAMALVKKGAALMVNDSMANENLADTILQLINDENKQKDLGINAQKSFIPNASKLIVEQIYSIV